MSCFSLVVRNQVWGTEVKGCVEAVFNLECVTEPERKPDENEDLEDSRIRTSLFRHHT